MGILLSIVFTNIANHLTTKVTTENKSFFAKAKNLNFYNLIVLHPFEGVLPSSFYEKSITFSIQQFR
jgi:hypothetical protein